MRPLIVAGLALVAACAPGGDRTASEVCARAAAMYDRCEERGGLDPVQWEIVLDRWRGLCRAALTGETAQLQPGALGLWHELPEDVRLGLKEQAACGAAATTCEAYRRCDEGAEPLVPPAPPAPAGSAGSGAPRRPPLLVPG